MASINRRKFKCGHWKTPSNLRYRSKKEKGVQCKKCRTAQHAKWAEKNPEKIKEGKERRRQELLEPLLREQKNRCAICGEKLKYPYQDHDHRCCKRGNGCKKCRRGLLCSDCNSKLSVVEKPGWIKKARAYLRKWA